MYTFVLVVIILVLAYFKFHKSHRFWQDQGVPCTPPTPFVGHMAKIVLGQRCYADITIDIYNQFPGKRYCGYYKMYQPILMIRDPELIKKITIRDFEYFTDHNPFGTDKLSSKSLFNLRGQSWKEMRSILSPCFTSSQLKNMYIFMRDYSEYFTNYISQKIENGNADMLTEDMTTLFSSFSCDVAATTVFGLEIDSLRDPENLFHMAVVNTTEYLEGFSVAYSQLVPSLYKVLNIKLFPRDVLDYLSNLLSKTVEYREKTGADRPDIFKLLMKAKKSSHEYDGQETKKINVSSSEEITHDMFNNSQKRKLTHEEALAQVLSFFFAGIDVVAMTICFTAHELATHPREQKKLQQEIVAAYEKCENGKISHEEVLALPYLDMVVSESLRLWPNVFQLDRVCVKDYEIPPVDGEDKPLIIKKGQMVVMPENAIHRDPKYFPEPDKFDPERFNKENKDKIQSGTYLPLGLGPRYCIGSRYGVLTVKIMFFYLLLKFDLVQVKQTQVPLKLRPTHLTPSAEKGFWMGLRPSSYAKHYLMKK